MTAGKATSKRPSTPSKGPGPKPLTPSGFADIMDVSRETLGRLQAYVDLLEKWNQRINLVSRAGMADIWRRHILDSAQILKYLPESRRSLMDFGSGAGFPGLVLAILGVEGMALVESDSRKCAFLAEAARVSGVSVVIHNQRLEHVPPSPVDVITARACAPLEKLLHYAARFWASNTCLIVLKGAHIDKELTDATKRWIIDVESHPSLTDSNGTVLCIRQLKHDR